jgi:hypothetical protein
MASAYLQRTLCMVVELLVNGEYAKIAEMTKNNRLSSGDIQGAILGYGRKLVKPPDEAMRNIDSIEIRGKSPREWSVIFDLWTAEDGRSDLSLEITIYDVDCGLGLLQFSVDGIHVL